MFKRNILAILAVSLGFIGGAFAQTLTIDIGPVIMQTGTVAQADAADLTRGTLLLDGNDVVRYYDGSTVGGLIFGGISQATGDGRYVQASGTNLTVVMKAAIGPVTVDDNMLVNGIATLDSVVIDDSGGGSGDLDVDGIASFYGGASVSAGLDVTSGKLTVAEDPVASEDVGSYGYNNSKYASRYESETFVIMEPAAAFAVSSYIPLKFFPDDYKYTTTGTFKSIHIGLSENAPDNSYYYIRSSASPLATSLTLIGTVSIDSADEGESLISSSMVPETYLFINTNVTNEMDYLTITVTYEVGW